jgi:hypothetical protein
VTVCTQDSAANSLRMRLGGSVHLKKVRRASHMCAWLLLSVSLSRPTTIGVSQEMLAST